MGTRYSPPSGTKRFVDFCCGDGCYYLYGSGVNQLLWRTTPRNGDHNILIMLVQWISILYELDWFLGGTDVENLANRISKIYKWTGNLHCKCMEFLRMLWFIVMRLKIVKIVWKCVPKLLKFIFSCTIYTWLYYYYKRNKKDRNKRKYNRRYKK